MERLQQRKEPKKQQEFIIKITNKETIITEPESQQEGEIVNAVVVLKDKRKQYKNLVDRELILNRIKHIYQVENQILSVTNIREREIVENVKEKSKENEEKDILEESGDENQTKEYIPDVLGESGDDGKPVKDNQTKENSDVLDEPGNLEQLDILDEPIKKPKAPRGKKPKQADKENPEVGPVDLTVAKIGKSLISDRLPVRQKLKMGVSSYYMNNRKLFIQQLSKLFRPYHEKIAQKGAELSCKTARNESIDFELLTHQLVVRDYLNLYTPYRGLLLYHGLGSGKTCTSIGIAEGMKTDKSIVLMTPASLKMNFFSELKKCGDVLYKKNQFWEFISIVGEPENVRILSSALGLTQEYIRERGGAWLTDITKRANFSQLSDRDQKSVDEQLNAMIRNKYQDINYNGLTQSKIDELTNKGKTNPFDNKVVIIDEAHNLVSRIANSARKKTSIAYRLYQALMDATNVKIILLTGTPIINTPREIGILFNILRGFIKTWVFQIQTTTTSKINRDILLEYFRDAKFATYDYVEYSGDKLTITRNPFGFINTYKKGNAVKGGSGSAKNKKSASKTKTKRIVSKKKNQTKKNTAASTEQIYDDDYDTKVETIKLYDQLEKDMYEGGGGTFEEYSGIRLDEIGNISDSDFQKQLTRILESKGMNIVGKPKIQKELCLPDDEKLFNELFINNEKGELVNTDLLKRRILGLTSYFRSAQEQLLPSFVKTEDGSNYHTINIDMSDHQFEVYEKIRKAERDEEAKMRKRKAKAKGAADEDANMTSTYRIYSRSACNFAFPNENPRPMVGKIGEKDIDINAFNGLTEAMVKEKDDYFDDADNEVSKPLVDYQQQIKDSYDFLAYNPLNPRPTEFLVESELSKYSPKFHRILENIKDPENKGLHLLYSQFRTLEGIGIFRLVLEANGFVEFKISKKGGEWTVENHDVDIDKPRFVLYTGTETPEEKEIIRNIYNSAWDFVPPSIVKLLREKHVNNFYGEIIQILMITSSGAEGINLRNTRFVHIMEPYWNMVRVDQVVGRARRICSHEDLPEELRTVQVFIYLCRITQDQLAKNIEMKIHDLSKLSYSNVDSNGKARVERIPFTTDQYLFEIAQIKDSINRQILTAVKETAIDCSLYNTNPDEPLVCYGFGKVASNNFGSYPVLETDRSEKVEANLKTEKMQLVGITVDGVKYAMDKKTKVIYDFASYKKAKEKTGELIVLGKLDPRTQQILFDNV